MARMPSTRRLPQVPAPVLVPASVQAPTVKPLAAQAAAPVVVQPTAVALAPAVAPGKGVVSQTNTTISHAIGKSSSVFVNGKPIVRTGDSVWMNWKAP